MHGGAETVMACIMQLLKKNMLLVVLLAVVSVTLLETLETKACGGFSFVS